MALDIMKKTEKICITCDLLFVPSSNHKECPACRYQNQKNACPNCGELKNSNSSVCSSCRKDQQAGSLNPNWKGGHHYHKKGYVMVRQDTTKYVMEHRLVMEEMIGRPLTGDENVHHINGVRDDNRPENLELWVSSQPAGQRAEDLVAWAKEILHKYDNEKTNLSHSSSKEEPRTPRQNEIH